MWSGADIAKALDVPATSIYRAVRNGSLIPDARSERIFLFRTASLRRVLDNLAGQLSALQYARCISSFDLEPTALDESTVRLQKVQSHESGLPNATERGNSGTINLVEGGGLKG